jgi:hypothetical protein
VTAPPTPATDKAANRKPIDAAATAAYTYGHPSAVGKGLREPIPRTTGKPKAAKGKAAAAEAADESESESEETE